MPPVNPTAVFPAAPADLAPPHPMRAAMPRRVFYFLRHGQTDWNLEGRLQGHTDTPLNATGVAQARMAAQRLRGCGITRLVASPLARAWHTAELVQQALGMPLHADPHQKERAFGSFEGELHTVLKARHGLPPEGSITTILPPDAEQWPQTCARMASAIGHTLALYPHDVVLFVGHGANFRALHEVLCGGWREAANAEPVRFVPGAAGWGLEVVG